MSQNDDERLEGLLRTRRLESASANLSERIIRAARRLPQRDESSFWQSIGDLFNEFHLPRPAYVLAAALALGIGLGFTAPQDNYTGEESIVASGQGFLTGDEGLL